MIKKINLLFLTLFYVGKIKYAPGTLASFIICLMFLFLINYLSIITLFFLTLLIFTYSIWAINISFDSFEDNDPQEIVIDEVVGQMIPLLVIPVYETLYMVPKEFYCIASFLLFRLFDIWKPFPISYVDDNTKGAIGIMLDDVIAGTFTVVIIIIGLFFIGG